MDFNSIKNYEELTGWINNRKNSFKNLVNFNNELKKKVLILMKENQKQELKNVVIYLEEINRDISILARNIDLAKKYDFGSKHYLLILEKIKIMFIQNIEYSKKWNKYMKKINETMQALKNGEL